MADQSTDNPMADYLNMMGMQGMTGQNPYLTYQGKIPMAGFYTGQDGSMPPTDAMGKPIQSFQTAQAAHDAWTPPAGTTTLNQTQQTPTGGRQSLDQVMAAAQKAGSLYATDPNTGQTYAQERAGTPEAQFNAVNAQMGSPAAPMGGGGVTHDQMGNYNAIGQLNANQYMSGVAQEQPTAAPAAAAAPTNPVDMRQAYLDALANPGKVTTPGATQQPPPAATGSAQPSVMQAFLAAHPSGGTGSNAGFFNTLNQLQSQKGTQTA